MTRPLVDQETFKKNNHKVHHNNPTGKSTDLQEFLFEKQREFFRSVFSSAKPVTLVDVLGNILDDNELSYGTNDHRVITSDKTCGSGRPDSWGLLYAQWTRDRWCGRHRKGRCAAQEGRTIFRCFGIRRSISFWVSSGVRYHCGIVCIGSGASAAGLERNFPPPEAADPGCLVKGQLMVDQLQQVRRGLRHCRICRGQ